MWALNTLHTVFYQPAQLTCNSWRTGPWEVKVLRNCLKSLLGLLHVFIPHKPPYSKGSSAWFLASYLSTRKANSPQFYSGVWKPTTVSCVCRSPVTTMITTELRCWRWKQALLSFISTCFVACRLLCVVEGLSNYKLSSINPFVHPKYLGIYLGSHVALHL